jgi:nondiscriminating glutamyl-tRNA synthetase
VVDDLAMEITHVLRANDHLTNTAAQVLLYEALEEDPPKFAHVGLVLGEDRSKLSKRTGDAFVGDFRKKGYLPEALFNFLALLGWTPEGEEELFSKEELIRQFSLERLANHPAVFDMDKLNWMNAQYIRQLTEEQLLERALPFLEEAGLVELPVGEERREWLAAVVGLIQDEVTYLAEVPELAEVFFDFTEVGYTEEARRALGQEHVPMLLQEFAKKIQSAEELDRAAAQRIFRELRDETELGGRKVFMPIRAALTGTCHGPELYSLIPLLGEDCIFNRVDEARDSS